MTWPHFGQGASFAVSAVPQEPQYPWGITGLDVAGLICDVDPHTWHFVEVGETGVPQLLQITIKQIYLLSNKISDYDQLNEKNQNILGCGLFLLILDECIARYTENNTHAAKTGKLNWWIPSWVTIMQEIVVNSITVRIQ